MHLMENNFGLCFETYQVKAYLFVAEIIDSNIEYKIQVYKYAE
jgi:hypothetical protein